MKKVLIFTVLLGCICAFCAENAFKSWTIAEVSIRKDIAKYVSVKDNELQINAPDNAFLYFSTVPYEVKYGNIIRISGNASGKGLLGAGYNGYADKGYKFTSRNLKNIQLTAEKKPFSFDFVADNEKTGAVRPFFQLAKGGSACISDLKIEIVSSVFDGWTMLIPAMRKLEKDLIQKSSDGAFFVGKEQSYGYFDTVGFPVEAGQKVRMTGKISGKGTVSAAIFGYVDKGYKNTMYLPSAIKVTPEVSEFNIVLPVGIAKTHYCRPVFNIGKNTEITVSDLKITVEK